jgi:hypothetical protein
VLKRVRERDQTPLSTLNSAKLLRDTPRVPAINIVGESIDPLQELVLVLLVVELVEAVQSPVPEG